LPRYDCDNRSDQEQEQNHSNHEVDRWEVFDVYHINIVTHYRKKLKKIEKIVYRIDKKEILKVISPGWVNINQRILSSGPDI